MTISIFLYPFMFLSCHALPTKVNASNCSPALSFTYRLAERGPVHCSTVTSPLLCPGTYGNLPTLCLGDQTSGAHVWYGLSLWLPCQIFSRPRAAPSVTNPHAYHLKSHHTQTSMYTGVKPGPETGDSSGNAATNPSLMLL